MSGKQKPTQKNPFKPGAGHSPPFLAGREQEKKQFADLLDQTVILQNVVLTGLRGVGKTVLMEDVYKPLALKKDWVWVGSDFSESAFISEKALCLRFLTDLSLFTFQLSVTVSSKAYGLKSQKEQTINLSFEYLMAFFDAQPGLFSDKLKATLELTWKPIEEAGKKGVLFAYDEAQLVQDRPDKDEFPLAMMLEVLQSIQRKGLNYMILLTGLPTLFPKLVESRTYAERMFVVQDLGRLSKEACLEAIKNPLANNAIQFTERSIELIVNETKCYPYFIQYLCREAYDYFKTWHDHKPNEQIEPLPIENLIRKLDSDFFLGRWSRVTDRQRELLLCIACLTNAEEEFTVVDIVNISRSVASKHEIKPFKTGDISQMLPKLIEAGLVYKNRYGKYSFAVPLFSEFIKRQFMTKQRTIPASLFDGM